MCDASGSCSAFHCRKFRLNITYRRNQSLQGVLKACRTHRCQPTYRLLNVKRRSITSSVASEYQLRRRESPIPIPQKPSIFLPFVQRNAFRRRGVHQQSRSFDLRSQQLRPSPTPTAFAEVVGNGFPVANLDRLCLFCSFKAAAKWSD